jgi:signal transduction histidine kinase/ActR/RegA family two-component response regulator
MERRVSPARTCEHIVQFYENEAAVCDSVAQFLGDGLVRGEAVLVVAGEKNRRGISAALRNGGHDPDQARAEGRFTELDAEDTLGSFMQGDLRRGMPDDASFRRAIGRALDRARSHRPELKLRVYGEMVDILTARGNEAATARLEELWNDLGGTRSFQLYCGYSLNNFPRAEDGEAFRRICALHTHVVPAETYDESLDRPEQRRRVAELQQRAAALEAEVHERKNLEKALRQEQERLCDANRRKDEFIALLSHELRNPLAPILTSLDVMDVRNDATSRREREIIRRQARHLAALVEDLLDVSRVASGKVTLQKQPMEFISIATTALEMASPLIEERRHTLDLAIPRMGLLLEADPVRLPQVLSNLLTNAAKYTPAGGRIAFAAERQGNEIVVTVEDSGIGIAHEALGNIFAPFVQGSRTLDRADGGLGLGLTLVRSLTQLHGGSVSAESDGPGTGSRFMLRLPALSELPSRDHLGHHSGNGTSTNGNGNGDGNGHENGRGHRILIVDDNRDGAYTLAELVRHLGFQARTAHDGHEALEVMRTFRPDTAFIDIGLPEMDGYTLATRMREMRNGDGPIRLVAVTGYGQATDREKGVVAGFDAHAVKPLELGTLRELLRHAMEPAAE